MRECSDCGIAQSLSEFRHRNAKPIKVCKSCERNKQREYYWRNPSAKRAQAAASMRKLRADPSRAEEQRAKARAYYHAKGKHSERAYYERMKTDAPWTWRARNAKRNCSPLITEEWLRQKFADQGGRCALTGRPISVETFEIDHIVARARGGGDELSNLRLLCPDANQAKRAMSDGEFLSLCADVIETQIPELIGNAILQHLEASR